jgi:hypothetical protein
VERNSCEPGAARCGRGCSAKVGVDIIVVEGVGAGTVVAGGVSVEAGTVLIPLAARMASRSSVDKLSPARGGCVCSAGVPARRGRLELGVASVLASAASS